MKKLLSLNHKECLTLLCFLLSATIALAQETITVQTLTYDSTGRDYMFEFPEDDGTSYERILMLYNMRCKGARVSVPGNVNLGCGEWDYSCNTYIVDSSYTDSLASTHPSHIISGFDGDLFEFSDDPTYTFTEYTQKNVAYNNTLSEEEYTVGMGSETLTHPLNSETISARTQYVWAATELMSSGLTAGPITGIKLEMDGAAATNDFLRIRMAHTSASKPGTSTVLDTDLQQVFFLNQSTGNEDNFFKFYNNFEWDGTSNILVEFSFTSEESTQVGNVKGESVDDGIGMTSSGAYSNLTLTGNGNITLPSNGFDEVTDEITISLWSYGDMDALPRNTTIFEGTDNSNNRQANVHLPWSNGQVYWDCGYDGGYDRINKPADPSSFRGKWNHWAFTKDANSGEMKIFLNGMLWHSGTGLTRQIDLKKMNLGSDRNGNNNYFGNIDEFRVWNVALNEGIISEWMTKRVDSSHPYFDNLITYIDFDEGAGQSLSNAAPTGGEAQINGEPIWTTDRGVDRINGFVSVDSRPNVAFVSGTYELDIMDQVVTLQEENLPKTITEYRVVGTDLEVESTSQKWEAKPQYTFNEAGEILDSLQTDVDGTIEISQLDYFRKFPSRFEIMSFVTPYGIFLDLGEEGKTWTFDMTDFAPILKGKKRMYLTLGGQFQEEMDIKFVFIKGTPPREVKDIRQIWRSGRSINNANILADNAFAPVDYKLDEEGTFFKIRSAITGHGQEGEFIPRWHTVAVNDETALQWQAWKECADNPVYPQGGTWIYDRAGWCPGAPTDVQHIDITDRVNPGDIVNFEYTMSQATGDSRYIVNHQLVTYGSANFQNDARVADVIRPSNKVEYDRINPVCNAPVIVLENTGAVPLTSATITYYVDGGDELTYEWTGSLDFLETEEVELPLPDMTFWLGSGQTNFVAKVSNPNGVADEYENNNRYISPFEIPDIVNEESITILTITNDLGHENSFRIKDFNQNVVFSREEMEAINIYQDVVELSDGCYTLEIDDTGHNGMEFWAQPSQGSGSLTLLTEDNQLIKNIDPDFGSLVRYSFVKGQFTNIDRVEVDDLAFELVPNPNKGVFKIKVALSQPEDLDIVISDVSGKLHHKQLVTKMLNGVVDINAPELSPGMYYCTIRSGSKVHTRKFVVVE